MTIADWSNAFELILGRPPSETERQSITQWMRSMNDEFIEAENCKSGPRARNMDRIRPVDVSHERVFVCRLNKPHATSDLNPMIDAPAATRIRSLIGGSILFPAILSELLAADETALSSDWSADAQAAAFSRQSQAGHHGLCHRRCLAHRHVRSEVVRQGSRRQRQGQIDGERVSVECG